MNLAQLDRAELEAIILTPPATEAEPLRCSEALTAELLPPPGDVRSTRLRHVLAAAHELLVRVASQAVQGRSILGSPTLVKDFLKVHFAGAERETFVVLFLDAHMRVLATEELFTGTLTQTSVYPREIVRRALQHNAAALICAHSHPSGDPTPSPADQRLTDTLKAALACIDVRLIDHLVVAGSACASFAEAGLL
ncbi:MAG: DNA repair protein RadC [Burkholderiales bacterium]|nr:MAG: DNA repair protein RadC [Burkholderiales bacterium]